MTYYFNLLHSQVDKGKPVFLYIYIVWVPFMGAWRINAVFSVGHRGDAIGLFFIQGARWVKPLFCLEFRGDSDGFIGLFKRAYLSG